MASLAKLEILIGKNLNRQELLTGKILLTGRFLLTGKILLTGKVFLTGKNSELARFS